jgi:2,5-furandicarboxylate decarboxylase 1
MKDLRTFLKELSNQAPKQLVTIKKEIDCRFEITAIIEKLGKIGKYPVCLFENVKNLKGESGYRLVANIYADRKRFPHILNLPQDNYKMEPVLKVACAKDNPIAPKIIDKNTAPVKQVIKTGKEVDLYSLPIPIHWKLDGGPYLSQPVLTKDPDTEVYNFAFQRAMVRTKNETGIFMAGYGHNEINFKKHEKRGEACPVAIIAGHHPAFGCASYVRLPKEYDHRYLAGALMENPLRMVESETWKKDLLVPADAEVVIEGEILPNIRKEEGPFGEWLGYTSTKEMRPIIKVTAITSRKDPILNTVHAGRPSDHVLYSVMDAAILYDRVRHVSPILKDINLPTAGCGRLIVYASVKKVTEGEQKNVSLTLANEKSKIVVVVDDDINVFDENEVLWAIATRVQAGKNIEIIKGLRGTPIDPSIYDPPTHDCMIIDATRPTRPTDKPFCSVTKVPDEIMQRINLDEFLAQ